MIMNGDPLTPGLPSIGLDLYPDVSMSSKLSFVQEFLSLFTQLIISLLVHQIKCIAAHMKKQWRTMMFPLFQCSHFLMEMLFIS